MWSARMLSIPIKSRFVLRPMIVALLLPDSGRIVARVGEVRGYLAPSALRQAFMYP